MNDIDFYDKLSDEQKGMITAGFYNVLFVTEMTDFVLTDFVQELRKRGVYRQAVKFRCNQLSKERNAYNKRVCRTLTTDFDNFADMSDKFMEIIKPSYDVFFYSIKNELLKVYHDKEEWIDILVYIDVLTHLFKFANRNFCNWGVYYKKNIPDIFKFSGFLDLETVKWNNAFVAVVIEVCRAIRFKGRECSAGQMDMAYKIFQDKILDLSNTRDAIWSVYPDEIVSLTSPPQEYKPRQRWHINIK